MTSSGYDIFASQFSPDGRIFQIEYALKAVEKSGTIIALRGKDCVVFASKKISNSKLYEPSANQRIFPIDEHIGVAIAGFVPDARHIIEIARNEALEYRLTYKNAIPLKVLNMRLAQYIHAYTLFCSVRPFGAGIILGSYDSNGPVVSSIQSSGVTLDHFACSLGKAKKAAETEMENLELKKLSPLQLAKEAARIIYKVYKEEKDNIFELELFWIGKNTRCKVERIPPHIFKKAESYAKAAMAESDSSNEE